MALIFDGTDVNDFGDNEIWELDEIPQSYLHSTCLRQTEQAKKTGLDKLKWTKDADDQVKVRARYDGTSKSNYYRKGFKSKEEIASNRKMTEFTTVLPTVDNTVEDTVEDTVDDTADGTAEEDIVINMFTTIDDNDDEIDAEELDKSPPEDSKKYEEDLELMASKIETLQRLWTNTSADVTEKARSSRSKFLLEKYNTFRYGSLVQYAILN